MRIELPSDCEKIHLLFSGGMDSSILLYLLAKEVSSQQVDIPIICHTFQSNSNPAAMKNVIAFVQNKYPINISHRVRPGKYKIREITHLIQTTEPGYVFSGCNKVVEDKFTPTIYIKGDTPPWRGPALNEQHIRPFIDTDKIGVLQVYVEENVLELLSLTYSCGHSVDNKCGECYFCMERQWALNALQLTDD